MPCDKTAITSFTIVTFLTITSHSFAIPLPPVNNTGVELQPKTATRFSSASVPDSGTDPCLIPCSVFNPCEPWQRCVYDNGEDVTGFDRGHCKCPTNSWGVTTDCNGTNKTLTCVVITVRGDACDHDFDCPGDLRCIPSATYPYEKSCEPKRGRFSSICLTDFFLTILCMMPQSVPLQCAWTRVAWTVHSVPPTPFALGKHASARRHTEQ